MSTDLVGLTSAEVAQRVSEGRVNSLPDRSGRSTLDIVRANVFTRVNLILFVLLVIVLSTGYVLQSVFGLLIIFNSVIGIVQELRAKQTLDNLAVLGEAHPTVIRDGVERELHRDEVVEGDLIVVRPGDQIIVDGVVEVDDHLELDESMLTGEADAVPKDPGDEVLSGAFVASGTGTYRAVRVGKEAYAAQLTAQAAKFTLVNSELRQGIDRVLQVIGWILIPTGLLTIWVQSNQADQGWRESVLRTAGALVQMVPEGLVLLTSMAFAVGVVRLGRRQCLVQELPAIEGLARVSVVCADKTGTLTQNTMTLGEVLPVEGHDEAEARALLAQLVASDPAPNSSMHAIAESVAATAEPWQVTGRAAFTSAKKWSGTSFGDCGNVVLGAPDVLATGAVADEAERLASTGRRVLLLATCDTAVESPDAPGTVAPVAFVILDQAIRPDASETLDYFAGQGVKVKVISGDNAASVGAVTRSLGVGGATAVDARTLPHDDVAFADAVEAADVFGRVTPQQKRRIVGALQSRGHAVAMTGDGVNDVLALKDADLGVAMGTGSPATRSVAQVVLLDDRFATLPHVVAEGRRVIGNIERVAKLFLTKTVYAATTALSLGVLGQPTPFLPLHQTIIGWFTIGIPSFLLSLAPNRDRARTGFVRRVLAMGVPSGLVIAAASVTAYLLSRGSGEVSEQLQVQATTAALIALLIPAIWALAVVSRPWQWWRVALVFFAYVFYTVLLAWPWARGVAGLDISNSAALRYGLVAGLAGAVVVEVIWWAVGHATGDLRYWGQRRAERRA